MAASYSSKGKNEKITALVLGIIFIVATTVICYLVGWLCSQTKSFTESTEIFLNFKKVGLAYIMSAFSSLIAIAVYTVKFLSVAGKNPLNARFAKVVDKTLPFVYKGWIFWSVFAGVCTFTLSVILYAIAFSADFRLVAPLMIWVWLCQAGLCVATFYIPLFKPLKAN